MFGIISVFNTICDPKQCVRISSTDSELKGRPFYPIRSKRITIGSADTDDIRVYDHSLPLDFQMEILIIDQNSDQTNEFFVRLLKGKLGKHIQLNGEPVLIHCRKVELRNKDQITIGSKTLVFNKCKPLAKTLPPIENNENQNIGQNQNQTLGTVLDSTVEVLDTTVESCGRKTRAKRVAISITDNSGQSCGQTLEQALDSTVESCGRKTRAKRVAKSVTDNSGQSCGQTLEQALDSTVESCGRKTRAKRVAISITDNSGQSCGQTLEQALDSTVESCGRKTRAKRVAISITDNSGQNCGQNLEQVIDSTVETRSRKTREKRLTKSVAHNSDQNKRITRQTVPFIVDTHITGKQISDSSEVTTTENPVTKRQKKHSKQRVEKSDRVLRSKPEN